MRELTRVENSGGITASLQGRYASALYELASDKKAVTAVESDLDTLAEALIKAPDLAALIRNPLVTRSDAAKAIDGVAGVLELSATTKNFLGVLAGNGRLSALPEIIRAFASIAAAARGEMTAEVTSAHPLSAEQVDSAGRKAQGPRRPRHQDQGFRRSRNSRRPGRQDRQPPDR